MLIRLLRNRDAQVIRLEPAELTDPLATDQSFDQVFASENTETLKDDTILTPHSKVAILAERMTSHSTAMSLPATAKIIQIAQNPTSPRRNLGQCEAKRARRRFGFGLLRREVGTVVCY